MGLRDDVTVKNFFDNPNRSAHITEYTLEFDGKISTFKSYTLLALIHDLERMLFIDNKRPWDDRKYAKRVNRLFYLLFIDVFMTIDNGKERLQIFHDLKNHVFAQPLNNITNGIESFMGIYKRQDWALGEFLHFLSTLASKSFTSDDDEQSMVEMMNLFVENVEFVIQTIQGIRQYCQKDGTITSQNLYSGSPRDYL
jgi:hypothetical protein